MVDASDAPASEGVMVAFLPVDGSWCKQELPHMTLVYAGTVDKLQPGDFNGLAKDAAMLGMLFRPFSLQVTHLDVFGDEEKVDVLRFRPTPELISARRMVERWNASEHPFRPHATIGPAQPYTDARDFPRFVGFDRIMVGWGEDHLVFNLNNKY